MPKPRVAFVLFRIFAVPLVALYHVSGKVETESVCAFIEIESHNVKQFFAQRFKAFVSVMHLPLLGGFGKPEVKRGLAGVIVRQIAAVAIIQPAYYFVVVIFKIAVRPDIIVAEFIFRFVCTFFEPRVLVGSVPEHHV